VKRRRISHSLFAGGIPPLGAPAEDDLVPLDSRRGEAGVGEMARTRGGGPSVVGKPFVRGVALPSCHRAALNFRAFSTLVQNVSGKNVSNDISFFKKICQRVAAVGVIKVYKKDDYIIDGP
jgi:hypothetical protein